MASLRTEFDFLLPKGLVDESGEVHREGTMRLATARDELEPLGDPKVKDADDPYLTIIVIARVVTGLGTRTRLSPKDVENLFAADLAYLQDFYSIINFGTEDEIAELTASVDAQRTARRYAPSAAPVPQHAADRVVAEPSPAVATSPEAPEPAAQAPSRRTTAASSKRTTAVDGDDLTPRYDDDGMELPTPSRRARIEEVGRTSDRPKGAR